MTVTLRTLKKWRKEALRVQQHLLLKMFIEDPQNNVADQNIKILLLTQELTDIKLLEGG